MTTPPNTATCSCCGLQVERYRIIHCAMCGVRVCDNCTEPVDLTLYADEQLAAVMREQDERATCQQCTRGVCEWSGHSDD